MHTSEIYGWSERVNAYSFSIEKKTVYLEDNQTTKDYIRDVSFGYWFTTFSEAKTALLKELKDQKKELMYAIECANNLKLSDCSR